MRKHDLIGSTLLCLLGFGMVLLNAFAATPSGPQGVVTVREFRDVAGDAIADLAAHSGFPESPDFVASSPRMEWPTSSDDENPPPGHVRSNYAVQLLGYLFPPVTGTYVFAICSDDEGRLFLSSDDSPANKRLIASEVEWNRARLFRTRERRSLIYGGTERERLVNFSEPIHLEAHQPYYIEALMKEGTGRENLAVAWQIPGGEPILNGSNPIPGRFLAAIDREDLLAPYLSEVTVTADSLEIQVRNGDGDGRRQLVEGTARLKVNGQQVAFSLNDRPDAVTVRYEPEGAFSRGVFYEYELEFEDDGKTKVISGTFENETSSIPSDFRIPEELIDRNDRGFDIVLGQAEHGRPGGDALEAVLAQLASVKASWEAGTLGDNVIEPDDSGLWNGPHFRENGAINYSHDGSGSGFFHDDRQVPGTPGRIGRAEYVVMEATAVLELQRGHYRMGVHSDDGFRVMALAHPDDVLGIELGLFDGSRSGAETVFEFSVDEDGFYSFKLLWWQGGGPGSVEWYLFHPTNRRRELINSTNADASFPAFRVASSDLPAYISEVTPGNGTLVPQLDPQISATIAHGATPVPLDSIRAWIDNLPARVETAAVRDSTHVSIHPERPMSSDDEHDVRLRFEQGQGERLARWSFVTPQVLPMEHRLELGSLRERGFRGRIHLSRSAGDIPTNHHGEEQLAGEFGPSEIRGDFVTRRTINYKNTGSSGNFSRDQPFPNLGTGDQDGFVLEVMAYLELEAGVVEMGVHSDDGFAVSTPFTVAQGWLREPETTILGEYNGGRSGSDTHFSFFVEKPGLYPFRLLYKEGILDAHLEWWSITRQGNALDPQPVLINDPNARGAIRAFLPPEIPPRILHQTDDLSRERGSSVELSVLVAGSGELEYEWFFNNRSLVGEMHQVLRLTNLESEQAGQYQVFVSNESNETVASRIIQLTVTEPLPPRITEPPSDHRVPWAGDVELTVKAEGTAPLHYKWLFNGVTIEGESRSSLKLLDLRPEQSGEYRVIVANRTGLTDVATVQLTVGPAPAAVLTKDLEDLTVWKGERFTFSVSANGVSPLTYKWFFNGREVFEQSGESLSIANALEAHSGSYRVDVLNSSGVVTTSRTAFLTVMVPEPPRVTLNTNDVSAEWGAAVILVASVEGTPPFEFQWFLDGQPLPGETSPRLQLESVTGLDAGRYVVLVRNQAETPATSTATVVVDLPPPPVIVQQPVGSIVAVGESVTLAVVSNGLGLLSYQWFFNDSLIPEETSSILSVEGVTPEDAGNYRAVVTNSMGAAVASEVATISVLPPQSPEIVAQSTDVSVSVGETVILDVTAVGSPPLNYQWSRDGVELSGETDPEIHLERVTLAMAGRYQVRVGSPYGSALSLPLTLSVIDPFAPPENDRFENASVLSGDSIRVSQSNRNAGRETSEPNHAGNGGGRSIWWRWNASYNGTVRVDTEGSEIDTVLGVYSGESIDRLREIASNDDNPNGGVSSLVEFRVEKGAEYFFAIDTFGGVTGTIHLSVEVMIERPRLRMRKSGRNLILSWNSTSSDFKLERTKELRSAQWIPVEVEPILLEDSLTIKVPIEEVSGEFFRLRWMGD